MPSPKIPNQNLDFPFKVWNSPQKNTQNLMSSKFSHLWTTFTSLSPKSPPPFLDQSDQSNPQKTSTNTNYFLTFTKTNSYDLTGDWHDARIMDQDHAQITITKLVALGLGNPSLSVHCNGEGTRLGFLTHVIHDRSYWDSYWWTNEKRDDVIYNEWNCRISPILWMILN